MSPKKHPRAVRRGYTLIEMIVSMVILLLLAGLAFTALRGVRTRALSARAEAELKVLAQALEEYKRQYGDYPMTGRYSQVSPLEVDPSRTASISSAQVKFFNALSGVYGPKSLVQTDAYNGKVFVDYGKVTLEVASTQANSIPQVGNDPRQKREVANTFVDPWGRRYVYYYKRDDQPATSNRPWQNPSYVLFSAGPDGDFQVPGSWTGFIDQNFKSTLKGGVMVNADNVYANPF